MRDANTRRRNTTSRTQSTTKATSHTKATAADMVTDTEVVMGDMVAMATMTTAMAIESSITSFQYRSISLGILPRFALCSLFALPVIQSDCLMHSSWL